MFWPDDQALLGQHLEWPADETVRGQDWWPLRAWDEGPTFGQLVSVLRPALHAALLLGWQVDSIEVGIGSARGTTADWQSIDLATLRYKAAKPRSDDRPFEGPNIKLAASQIADLTGAIDGTFAIPFEIPIIGSDIAVSEPGDGTSDPDTRPVVPAQILDGISALVEDAIGLLKDKVPRDQPPAREVVGGLVWMLDPSRWRGLNDAATARLAPVAEALQHDPEQFLRGQLTADRSAHAGPDTYPRGGPPGLAFLLWGKAPAGAHVEFWKAVSASLQERGEAHRFPGRARTRFADPVHQPTWLDAVFELVWRGVVLVDGLIEVADPPEPITVRTDATGDMGQVTQITLTIWRGDAEVTLRRETVFGQELRDDLEDSVAWDYAPGSEQVRPTVIIVACRGVAIEYGHRRPEPGEVRQVLNDPGRPWDLEIYRVQDLAMVPSPGAVVDPAILLAASLVEPGDPPLLVKPKPDGVLVQFPHLGIVPATEAVEGDIPVVVELTLDPFSGTSAYSIDVHYYVIGSGSGFIAAGAHLCVWATPDVRFQCNLSPSRPQRGNPSAVREQSWLIAWELSAEFWEADRPEPLPRPFSAVLPLTESAAVRAGELPAPATPRLDFDPATQLASHGSLTLTPALHEFKQFGYVDSLFLDLLDVLIGFVPFVGDVADIAEVVYAWQTGYDRWGRPVSEFQLALLTAGAAVPIVSGSFVKNVGELLAGLPAEATGSELGRLMVPARTSDSVSVADAEAALGLKQLYTDGSGPSGSPSNRAAGERLVRGLAEDDSAVRALAERLVAGRRAGWLTIADVLTPDGSGFTIGPLQTAYTRFLRDRLWRGDVPPHVGPQGFVEHVVGGG